MNTLAYFPTQAVVSNLLVSQLDLSNANAILDLGAGCGSLIQAVQDKMAKADCTITASELNPRILIASATH